MPLFPITCRCYTVPCYLQAGAGRGRATVPSAKAPAAVSSGAAKRPRGTSKKDACGDDSDGDAEDFFDAHERHNEADDDDDEVQVSRVVAAKGGSNKPGRSAAGAGAKKSAKSGAVAKKGFLLEVSFADGEGDIVMGVCRGLVRSPLPGGGGVMHHGKLIP